jgi:hypothetical protein
MRSNPALPGWTSEQGNNAEDTFGARSFVGPRGATHVISQQQTKQQKKASNV